MAQRALLAMALAAGLAGCHADSTAAPAAPASPPVATTLPAAPPEPSKPPAPPAAPAEVTTLPAPPAVVVPHDWLLLATVDGRGRRPIRPDAVFAKHLLAPDAPPPVAGESLTGETGTASWVATQAGDNGAPDLAPLKDKEAGWAWTSVDSAEPRVMLLAAPGFTQVFVNGVPVPGDPYALGMPPLPVALRAGRNEIALAGVRDKPSLRLLAPPAPVFVAPGDVTAPDLEVGQRPAPGATAAALVVNASLQELPLRLTSGGALADGSATPFAELSPPTQLVLPPLSVLKVPVPIIWNAEAAPPAAPDELRLPLRIGSLPGQPDVSVSVPLAVRAEGSLRRHTYVSLVDRSVQEYALRGPVDDGTEVAQRPGLVLTLHGAGVDEYGQAAAYSPKPDFWICAPSNRRPYGFDWQDWGRRDAYDALTDALQFSGADSTRVMLAGHSMGGHGTWFLAANDPDRFAAIAPSAGWRSFDTYGSRPAGALSALWRGADLASDVPALVGNLAPLPTFILHGTADDNVPISEAQAMEAALRAAGGAPQFHWQEGAGHWWDGDASPGVDCVDWPGIFELFRRAGPPGDPDVIDVSIADPWEDARHFWFVALQPLRYGEMMHISGERRRSDWTIQLATSNVRRCAVFWRSAQEGPAPMNVEIDGQSIPSTAWSRGSRFGMLLFTDGSWHADPGQGPPPGEKTPDRSGPFKRAFDNGFLLVYGTAGTPAENAELLARARSDAGDWWYRGNGCAPLLSDKEWLAVDGGREFAGRNVILYGNADSNAAWSHALPPACPLSVHRGELRLGDQRWQGEDLAAVFVWPRPDSRTALVGAFASSGVAGTRLLSTLSPFRSGVGYPDYTVLSSKVLQLGDDGVLAAGWFGPDWMLDPSQPHAGN